MRRILPPAGALAAALLLAPALGAQTAVTGTVVDSTRALAPLAGATVQLVSRTAPDLVRTTTTDSLGGYMLADVAAGEWLLGFLHPRLDELALQPPMHLVRAGGATTPLRVDLAVPSGRTIAAAVCGAASDSSGLLIGRVLAADGGTTREPPHVTVAWPEIVIGAGEIRRDRRMLTPPVTPDGRYVACDVPTDTPVLVRATAGILASGEVELQVPPFGVLQRDLLVAPVVTVQDTTLPAGIEPPRRGTARLTGRVARSTGDPMAGAIVVVQGSGIGGTTDARGTFTLDSLPSGTFMLEARAIGHAPTREPVDLRSDRTSTAHVVLDQRVATLDAVTVFGTTGRRGSLSEMIRRSEGGFGHFLLPDDLARRRTVWITNYLRMIPGVRITPTGGTGNFVTVRGQGSLQGQCIPSVWMDGMLIHEGAQDIDRLVSTEDLMAIEVYTGLGGVPSQFQHGSCGAIILWTKGRLR